MRPFGRFAGEFYTLVTFGVNPESGRIVDGFRPVGMVKCCLCCCHVRRRIGGAPDREPEIKYFLSNAPANAMPAGADADADARGHPRQRQRDRARVWAVAVGWQNPW